ncbi:MAG: LmeA family phospholipid-binding protein [Abditibacteriaceae bacterium]
MSHISNRILRCSALIVAFGIGSVLTLPPISPAQIAIAASQSGSRVTHALENYLRNRITSPGGRLDIKITPGAKADQGYFTEVLIVAKPASIKKRQFSLLRLHATNVHIDPNALLKRNDLETLSSTTTLYAEVTDHQLTAALAGGKNSSVMNLKVNFKGDLIQVSGNYDWGLFSGPFTATGKLRLGGGHQIVADIQSLKINGFEAPAFIKSKFSERINPLIDYTDLPFKPPFRKLVIQGNKAIVYA